MKLSKLIFMVRFINIMEQVWPVEEGATARLVPMNPEGLAAPKISTCRKAVKDAQKINKDCHKVYTSSDSLLNVN